MYSDYGPTVRELKCVPEVCIEDIVTAFGSERCSN